MKPLESFLLFTVFAANNISTADENSAPANSFNTKQVLSGSKFFKVVFGIKNILLIIFIYFILFASSSNAKNCLSFLPYGFNESYVHLPQSASFCVRQGKVLNKYQTDNYGGRLLNGGNLNNKNKMQVFGDSQVLGLEVENIKQHYLNNLYKKNNFILYAAPNNGPYEVINFLNKNKNILQKNIIVTFSFSTDIYRILDYWDPRNFVALKDHELDEILEHPFKYRLIVFKNLLLNKNFTISRYDNDKMQNLFLDLDKDDLQSNLIKYFDELNKTAEKLGIEIDFLVTHPYWVYSIDKNNKKLLLNKKLNEKIEKLICSSFQSTKRISKILISQVPNTLELDDLTFDKRHLKSTKIKFRKYKEKCAF
tara:strand:+ start:368 stop:1465 length:1098 start_codon:yes stop_codon:yes gene_type:complete